MNKLYTAMCASSLIFASTIRGASPDQQEKEKNHPQWVKYAIIASVASVGTYAFFKIYQKFLKGHFGSTQKVDSYQHPEWEFKEGKFFIKMVDPQTLELKTVPLDKPFVFYSNKKPDRDPALYLINNRVFPLKMSSSATSKALDGQPLQMGLLYENSEAKHIIVSVPAEWKDVHCYSHSRHPLQDTQKVPPLNLFSISEAFKAFNKACKEEEEAILVVLPENCLPERGSK